MLLLSEIASFFVEYFLFVLAFAAAIGLFLLSLFISLNILCWCDDMVDKIKWKIRKIKEEKKKKEAAQLVEISE